MSQQWASRSTLLRDRWLPVAFGEDAADLPSRGGALAPSLWGQQPADSFDHDVELVGGARSQPDQ
jgi:hypothetical protein